MNLRELKEKVDAAIDAAIEWEDNPEEITVSIQVDINRDSVYSDDVELHYDGDGCASGCVLVGDARQHIHLFNFEVRRISHNMLIHQTKAGDQPVIHRGTYREIFSSGPGWYRFANRIGHARSLFPGHLYVII